MHARKTFVINLLAGVLIAIVGSYSISAWPADVPAASGSGAPLISILGKFTARDVPTTGPAESYAPVRQWADAKPPAPLPGKGLAQHPMLYIGEGLNKMFLIYEGKVLWTYSTGKGWEYDDVWMLSNGNIVFSRMQYVAEVTPKKEVVWRYDAPPGTEIHTCQPIGLDKVIFVRNGLPPKVMLFDKKTSTVQTLFDLPAASMTDQKKVHGQFRRFRVTGQGTYLAPMLGMNRVVEYDKNWNEIWRYEIKSPWAAIRLKNGNTLITDEKDKLTREVNPKGETVWELKPEDLPAPYRFINTQSCTRLANGNTIICSRGDNGKGPQLLEVTPGKKVIWVLWDWKTLGPATAVQVLDDPGIPETPGDSEH